MKRFDKKRLGKAGIYLLLVIVLIISLFPIIYPLLSSFRTDNELFENMAPFNWHTIVPIEWTWENYIAIFKEYQFGSYLKNTLIMTVVTIFGQVGIALLLALMVDNIKRGAKVFRTMFFFPIVVSATALGLLFNLIFLYDTGMINQLLSMFGKQELTDWKSEKWALFTMMLPVMWQYVGFYFVIIRCIPWKFPGESQEQRTGGCPCSL